MKIGIDARLYNQTGVGRYIRNLIRILGEIDKENEYIVFLRKEDIGNFSPPNNRWKIKIINIRWHSFLEQVFFPFFLYKENLDLAHFPYFSIPIFYFKPFVVTIHDLTHLHFDTGKASTLPLLLYKIKRLGLKIILWWAVNKAKKVIAVSETTKKEIIDHYHIKPEKVRVIYEGVEYQISKCENQKYISKIKNIGQYILYVGNAYPHKNLERVIEVIREIGEMRGLGEIEGVGKRKEIKLVLVGPEDFFYNRLKDFVKVNNIKNILFYGKADDQELVLLYKNALFLIIPSLMEGFGLTALEAMNYGCLVLASNIPALREVCQEAAIYFNPESKKDIKEKILGILGEMRDVGVVRDMGEEIGRKISLGRNRAKVFSWEKMGKKTLEIYKEVIK